MVGEEVSPGVKLAAVYFDYVVLDLGGEQQQKLFLDGDEAAGASAAASPGTVSYTPLRAPDT